MPQRSRHEDRRARVRPALGMLFPAAPEKATARRAWSAAVQCAAVCAGVVVLLARVRGVPAWNCVYAEDYGIFLVQALQHPWHLLIPYHGYLQFLPRLIGQAVSLLPLTEAAAGFAVAGAVIAAGCALFTYHASAGFIRSPALRAVLAAALILLPVAPLEVVGNGVNTPWYILAALFWAVLWRPRTPAGMAVAAVIGFAATSSDPVAAVYAPLLVIRVIALPRLREHAVTAGWLAGWLPQVVVIARSYADHTQRLGTLSPPGKTIAYYFHTVVLRALGWHLSWRLESVAGQEGATLIIGAFLAVILGWAVITQGGRVRVFVLTAVLTGFVFTVFAAAITSYVVYESPFTGRVSFEPGSRYSVVPIVLLDAAAIVAVDSLLARRRAPAAGPREIAAVAALIGVLGLGWVTDYRYLTQRTSDGRWAPVAASWLHACQHSRTGTLAIPAWGTRPAVTVPCRRIQQLGTLFAGLETIWLSRYVRLSDARREGKVGDETATEGRSRRPRGRGRSRAHRVLVGLRHRHRARQGRARYRDARRQHGGCRCHGPHIPA
ncbi:MAG TPA: hypothetical protein VKG80_01275 [Trebonia sp.]|nr:hypothetical protein [Trebonia sp.]